MSITLSMSFGFKERVQDKGPNAELHDVDRQYEVIKMNWIGKKVQPPFPPIDVLALSRL